MTEKTPWNTALNMLARREYSQAELRTRLTERFPEQPDAMEAALLRLIDTGLQNDERYAEAFLRSQINRSRGPVRIKHEARQKGVAEPVLSLLDDWDIDWFELALAAARRKLGSSDPAEQKNRARIARFLAYRGFTGEHVRYSLEALLNTDNTDERHA
ncbi:regulatory protein RecX [Saccharospirillum impatiens]|uniref:regulatory protein RecX n=1 Tax=Saccharospirillum impatiens TaxID=169438 RepID=UPI0003FC66BC|nr:regulatory protein RecX [Saccharospirillum impatiens]